MTADAVWLSEAVCEMAAIDFSYRNPTGIELLEKLISECEYKTGGEQIRDHKKQTQVKKIKLNY
jgi:hypothetical protein